MIAELGFPAGCRLIGCNHAELKVGRRRFTAAKVNASGLHVGYRRSVPNAGSFKQPTRRPWARNDQIGSNCEARTSVSQRVLLQHDQNTLLSLLAAEHLDLFGGMPLRIQSSNGLTHGLPTLADHLVHRQVLLPVPHVRDEPFTGPQ